MIAPKHILITGASSGLGAALAQHYAAAGVRLALTGRDARRLSDIAALCRDKGATVETAIIDVTDEAALKEWIERIDAQTPLDLVIANAGISGGTGGGGESGAQARKIFAVNVTGVFNTIEPVIPRMTGRGQGQIAIVSSLSGFSGWPGAPAYSASKGAVRLYGEALRGALAARGVRVSVVCPGFIETPMTAVNPFAMPFLMTAGRAAGMIARGLAANRGRIAFPWPTHAIAWLFSFLPQTLSSFILRRMPEKPAPGKRATNP